MAEIGMSNLSLRSGSDDGTDPLSFEQCKQFENTMLQPWETATIRSAGRFPIVDEASCIALGKPLGEQVEGFAPTQADKPREMRRRAVESSRLKQLEEDLAIELLAIEEQPVHVEDDTAGPKG